jgi:hypothetical protein
VGRQERPAKLGIQVMVGSDDDEEVAKATLQLRRELLDLEVEAVELPPAGEPPPGTRAVELAAIGALLVTIGQSQLLANVVAAIRPWLAGHQQRSIKLRAGRRRLGAHRGVVQGAAAAHRRVAASPRSR